MSSAERKFLLGLTVILLIALGFRLARKKTASTEGEFTPQVQALAKQLSALETNEAHVSETDWKNELIAERYGRTLENLWDAVNGASNRLEVLVGLSAKTVLAPNFQKLNSLAYEIETGVHEGASLALNPEGWKAYIKRFETEGWELKEMELRHNGFSPTGPKGGPRSRYYCAGQFYNKAKEDRAILEGNVLIDWEGGGASEPAIAQIDATRLAFKHRHGNPIFTPWFSLDVSPEGRSDFIDPVITYDLKREGKLNIILACPNLLLRQNAKGEYESQPLCQIPTNSIFTGVIADFDNDGIADYLCARFEGLYLFKGSTNGTFAEAGRLVWEAKPHLHYAQVLTCGDVDGDGDLDVWLAQYKVPYDRGQMPSPYFDANDGDPSYLLLNDGHGNFADGTEAPGLAGKRFRRTYSASLADIDHDGDLDLILVSDFAGLDLFRNDGRGHFTQVTRDLVEETHAFGMSHVLADFDRDGVMDLLMIGMNSATAERLGSLGVDRGKFAQGQATRAAMVYGNRLYLGAENGKYRSGRAEDPLVRSGWSWGAAAIDFNNDGYPDACVANGHETRRSVRDYEPQFWLHDIYAGDSKVDIVKYAYFSKYLAASKGRDESYVGYERNRLFWNQTNAAFLEVGFLLGLGLQADSRNVLAEDLDGDGNQDLIMTTHAVWPEAKQTLHIFKNNLTSQNHWIGFWFQEEAGRVSPVGTVVTLYFPGGKTVAEIVTGDSYRSQHSPAVHFGLGGNGVVEKVEIQAPYCRPVTLDRPVADQRHFVRLPQREKLDH